MGPDKLLLRAYRTSPDAKGNMPVTTRRGGAPETETQAQQQQQQQHEHDGLSSSDDDEPLATQKPETYHDEPQAMDQDEMETTTEEVEVVIATKTIVTQQLRELPPDSDTDEEIEQQQPAASNTHQQSATKNPNKKRVPLQFAKPPSADALLNVQDLADYWIDHIFNEPEQSEKHYSNLKYFYGLAASKNSDVNFGRLHCRTIMAELVKTVFNEPLHMWDRDTWNDAIYEEICTIQKKLMRSDATAVFGFGTIDSMEHLEDETTNPAHLPETLRVRIQKLLVLVQLHMAIAPIRQVLEEAIDQQVQPNIRSDVLKDIVAYLEEAEFCDVPCLELLGQMWRIDGDHESEGDDDDNVYKLADIKSIGKILRNEDAFNLELLKEGILKLIRRLDRTVYGDEPSILAAKKYRYDPGAVRRERKRRQEAVALAQLDRERKKLKNNGPDPLSAALEKSKNVGGRREREEVDETDQLTQGQRLESPMRSSHEKQPQPVDNRAAGDDDGFMEDSEEEDRERRGVRPLVLPSPRRQRTRGMLQKQTYEADEGIFDENGKVKHRRAWTNAEDAALLHGVKEKGLVGRWRQIKDMYPDILHNRQTVQIKDRYRTLLARGEI